MNVINVLVITYYASSVNLFKNRIDKYLIRAGCSWKKCMSTVDKPMSSLSAAI